MTDNLNYKFTDTSSSISTFDELPLWSASFGLLLLKHLELKPGITLLDIGSGAGFPLLELAGRLGPTSQCIGIDTWINANERARQKAFNYGLSSVKIIDGSAEVLPFEKDTVDLIVSNLGINNFSNPNKVFYECLRVLKPGGKLAITTNLNGHWQEFYRVFEQTLVHFGRPDLVLKLKYHEEHRGSVSSISKMYTANGFTIAHHIEDTFSMRFLDGTAFLNHYFVKLGWLESWKEMIPAELQVSFFDKLEDNLNNYAMTNNGLTLSVPMIYIEGQKTAT